MSLYDFCALCTDDQTMVCIYDMNEAVEREVFHGTLREAMYSDYEGYDVDSFDLDCGNIILNIDTTEED